jgi:hypothetical protein
MSMFDPASRRVAALCALLCFTAPCSAAPDAGHAGPRAEIESEVLARFVAQRETT